MRELTRDRFGLGYRDELAAGILAHLERIDVLELVTETLLDAPRRRFAALQTLAAQVPLMLHGVSLGLASCEPVQRARLDAIARVIERVQPESWSEHLAFVRAGGIELGHLALPPRNEATVEGALRNLARARAVVGQAPRLENVASVIDPPCNTLDEPAFVAAIAHGAGCELLLDLQNLYTNAYNFGLDPFAQLAAMPLARVRVVHIAGGKPVRVADGSLRVLDDHLHDVPGEVYALLRALGRLAPQPLTVVLERDGAYPRFARLLAQLEHAREALAEGRALRRAAA